MVFSQLRLNLIHDRVLLGLMLVTIAMLTSLSIFAFVQTREFEETVVINDIEIGPHSQNYITGVTYYGIMNDGSLVEFDAKLIQSEFADNDAVNGVAPSIVVDLPNGQVLTTESDYFTALVDGSSAVLTSDARIGLDGKYSASSESFIFDGVDWRIGTVDSTFIRYPGGIATAGKLNAGLDEGDEGFFYELFDKVNIFLAE